MSVDQQKTALQQVDNLLKGENNNATVDDGLNGYSEYATLKDPAAEDCRVRVYDLLKIENIDYFDDQNILLEKGIVNFFVDLSKKELKTGAVSGSGEVRSWDEYEYEDKGFLPDNTDYQRCVPEIKLWEKGMRETRPESEFEPGAAYSSTDFELEDKGNVLWRLDTGPNGFPVGETLQGSATCILREHHRQVMFNAFSWMLRNAASMGLAVKNRTDPVPISVIAAVCGSAGIGKSRSLIFLMWFLLKKKSAFLLEAGISSRRYFCLVRPRANKIKFVTEEQAIVILSTDQSVLGIVDPKQFGANEIVVPSKLLQAPGVVCWTCSSADADHLPRPDKDSHCVMKFWVSPWILSHLQAVRLFFRDDGTISAQDVEDRFLVVGGVARAIFNYRVFKARSREV